MLFKGNSSKLELLIEKIQATKEIPDTLGTEPSLSWNSETADEDGNSLSPSSCETPNSVATDGNDPEISFTIGTTDSTPYACQFCEKAFPRLSYLKKHEQSHSDQMPFKCDFCQRLFKHKRSRDRHVKLHTGDKKYKCGHCDSAFSRSDHLKIHMKTHDHHKPYQCQVCNRGYNTAAALTSHMQNHKKESSVHSTPSPGGYRCLQCNGTFHTGEDLQAHVLQNHRPISSTTPEKPDIISLKRFSASPKTPSSSPSIKARSSVEPEQLTPHHMLLPFPMPKLACIYCTKDSFTSMESLQLHVQAFHGSLLNGELGESSHLLSPIPTPSGFASPDSITSPNGFPCSFCTMKFPTLSGLHKHAITVHSLSGYLQAKAKENAFCAQCAMAFPNSALYAEHFMLFHANNGHHRSKPVCSPEPLQMKPTDLSKKSKSCELPSSSTSGSSHSHTAAAASAAKKLKRDEDDVHSSSSSSLLSTHPPASSSSSIIPSEMRSGSMAHSNNNNINPIMSLGASVLLCSQCNAGFSDFESFRTHLKSHLEEIVQKFVCEECDSEFTSEEQLENHSMVHYMSTSTEYGCQSCLKLFGKPDELQKHLMDIHAHHLYRCALCKEMFDSKVSIQVHFAVKHSNECKLFRCNSCNNVFRSEIEFQVHVKMIHLRKLSPYRCLLCNSSFPTDLDLQFHLSTHQKQFTCKMCDAAFHVEFLLDKHMETHHSSVVNGNSNSDLMHGGSRNSNLNSNKSNKKGAAHSSTSGGKCKELKCDICDKVIGSDAELSSHRKQVHHILQSQGNVSDSSSDRTMGKMGHSNHSSHKSHQNHSHHHQQQHHPLHQSASSSSATGSSSNNNPTGNSSSAGTLSLSCAYCNENCKSRTDLENHMKTHQVVASGKHKCNICDEVCPSATLLAEHKLTHCKVISGTTCTGCKQNISSEEQYYYHMKQHSSQQTLESVERNSGGVGSTTGSSSKNLAAQLPIPCIICRQTLMTEIEVQMHSKFHTRGDEGGGCNSEASPLKTSLLNSAKSPSAGTTARAQAQCCLCFKTEERPDINGRNGFTTEPQPFICDDCYAKKTSLSLPFPPRFFLPPGSLADLSTKSPSSTTPDDTRPTSSNSAVTTTTTPELKTYQCIKCQMSFASEQEIQAHVVVHLRNEGSSLDCYVCNQVSFDTPLKLQCHLIEHTFEGCSSFTCYMCSSVFTTAPGLQQHMVEHGLHTRPYDCSLCHLKFFFRTELENHMVTHEQLKELLKDGDSGMGMNLKIEHGGNGNSSTKRPLNLSSNQSERLASSSPVTHANGGGNVIGNRTSAKQKRKRFFYRSDDSDEEMEPVVKVKVEISPAKSDTGPCGHVLSSSESSKISEVPEEKNHKNSTSSSSDDIRPSSSATQKIDNQSEGAR
ncbi:unnamed protein product [Orchesella dallaii]|uniref:C2H2-type domain-containing protein n=1 Tax=Orchesella dallaii TaxID=48710 RepID=A0ABP1PKT1_9HEXA